jgi:hypothetical protein
MGDHPSERSPSAQQGATSPDSDARISEATDNPDSATDFFRNPSYERKVVVFYDVLGWRNHILSAGSAPPKIGSLRRLILQHVRSLPLRSNLDLTISTFSDNIVISQPVCGETPLLIMQLAMLQIAAAMSGFLLRGGVTIGDLFHDRECVFGPGLNRAYELESKTAYYPRFVLDSDVAKEFGNIGDIAVRDGDVLFLDPFRLGFMDYLRGSREMMPKDVVLAAGLPAPDNRLPQYTREGLLRSMLDKLRGSMIASQRNLAIR